jgi:HSP20 family protein
MRNTLIWSEKTSLENLNHGPNLNFSYELTIGGQTMHYIARYEPGQLVNEVNKIIEQAFRPLHHTDTSNIETSQWTPAVDIKEEKNQFIILADLPGVDKNDIHISMENNILTLKGQRLNETQHEEKSHYFRSERIKGNFYRRFTLPETVDGSKIEAKVTKGVLEIIIPKKEAAQPRLIKIQCED